MKNLRYLLLIFIITSGWLCGKSRNKDAVKNQPSPNQKSKSILLQAREHFQWVFNELKQSVFPWDIKSIFRIIDQNDLYSINPKERSAYLFNQKIQHASVYYRIGNKKSQEEVEKWIRRTDINQLFSKHFTSIIQNTQDPKDNEVYSGYYVYLALSLNLINQDTITQYLNRYLEQKATWLSTKLEFLEVTKKHSEAYEVVKTHFYNNFNDYCSLLKGMESNSLSPSIHINEKLKLAINLKKIDSDQWEKANWKLGAPQELENFLLMPLPKLDQYPCQDAYPMSYFECFRYFFRRFFAICLWQELYTDKVPDYVENWFQVHLKKLENWMSNLEASQYVPETICLISLCFHEKIREKACGWIKNYINEDRGILTKDSKKYFIFLTLIHSVLFDDFFNLDN